MLPSIATVVVAQILLAQDLTSSAQIVERLGIVGALLLFGWMFATDRICTGATRDRLIGERDASQERERALHRRIEEDIIPLVTSVSATAQQLLDVDRGPRN